MVTPITQEKKDAHERRMQAMAKEQRERAEREAIDRGDYLWYVIRKHTNMRVSHVGDIPTIFTDYATAREAGKFHSKILTAWYTPMRVSEYNATFGRFMEGF